MITTLLANDLRKDGIHVVAIHPGWMKTDMGGHGAPGNVNTNVSNVINVLRAVDDEQHGKIINYKGKYVEP